MKTSYWLLSCFAAVALYACGHHSGDGSDANGSGDGDGGNGMIDAGFGADAPFSGTCTPGSSQCSNCNDDDSDGKIDGFDPECTGPLDNDESSFKTGIPGDNIDATSQDCFFDGNSGSGNDGCNQHTCCLLQSGTQPGTTQQDRNECHQEAPSANQNKYTIANCYAPWGTAPVPTKCSMVCGKLAPPGCDCFGCCTICNPALADTAHPGGCFDIDINPAVSPNCDSSNVNDPAACKQCGKNPDCGNSQCGGATCILCPGQDPSSLPPECNNTTTCPTGIDPCGTDNSCPTGTYCSIGCCIGTLQ
ncbi:MAG TPA: hypothetical protein VMZ53_01745 [Kofleriaceae bacterium]|nr:hypothetical protein [Kofleriaceae bacterium]